MKSVLLSALCFLAVPAFAEVSTIEPNQASWVEVVGSQQEAIKGAVLQGVDATRFSNCSNQNHILARSPELWMDLNSIEILAKSVFIARDGQPVIKFIVERNAVPVRGVSVTTIELLVFTDVSHSKIRSVSVSEFYAIPVTHYAGQIDAPEVTQLEERIVRYSLSCDASLR